MATDLLLVGAGHAHLHVLQRAGELVAAGYRVRLLAPRWFSYSGVASASAAGSLPAATGRVDVLALARRSGVEMHVGTLATLDLDRRIATTVTGEQLTYVVLSLNLGSVVAPQQVEVDAGVVRVKPLEELTALDGLVRARAGTAGATVTVVGAGSTGLETAAHWATRADVASVQLVEAGPVIGPELPARARRRVERLLARRGVQVHTGRAVQELGLRAARFADGTTVSHDVAVLATGLVAPPVLGRAGLGDARGVPVRATMQHRERDEVYAVGDCAHFTASPLPRIGVHGVRQGPVLVGSLLARSQGRPLPSYRPQRHALNILDLGGGVGLAVRGRWWWHGRAALWAKRVIDRRWLEAQSGPVRPAAGARS